MCEPMTMGIIGGSLLSGLMASKQQAPNIPAPAPVEAPPQAEKTPDTAEVLKQMSGTGQAGGSVGTAQTFLTPTGGVDQKSLMLDRKSLLH